jgi:uncharacterized peroxidase-related enzyme
MPREVRVAWIDLPGIGNATDARGKDSFEPPMQRLISAHPRIGPAFDQLRRMVMGPSPHLSPVERQIIATVAAVAQDCTYCTYSHAAMLRKLDPPGLADAIASNRWREYDLSPRERALCEVAEKLSADPNRMTERDWQPLRNLGFGDEALLEVGHIVGLMNYTTRLASGFGLIYPGALEPDISR